MICKECGKSFVGRTKSAYCSKSCGAIHKIINIENRRFKSVIAIKRVGSNNLGHSLWLCKCDCGNEFITLSNRLLTGNTGTCGCRNGHGKRYTRIYRTWINMKQRCLNPKEIHYKRYGARGIKVCNEWVNNFMSFYEWAMRFGYKDNLTIDRKDNDGNYEPNNCQWITNAENAGRSK